MRKRERRNLKNRVRREVVFVSRTYSKYDTITNTPIDPKTGRLNFRKQTVEETKKIFKGYHSLWKALLANERGGLYLRIVLA